MKKRPPLPGAALAYVYCDYSQQGRQSTLSLLSNILKQLLQTRSSIPDYILASYREHQQYGTTPNVRQIADMLRRICSDLSVVHLVIDALDEFSRDEAPAHELIRETTTIGLNVKLLCTSRPSRGFENLFADATCLEISASNEDIRMYLESCIAQEGRLKCHIRANPDLGNQILSTIVDESQGMFVAPVPHPLLAALANPTLQVLTCKVAP